MPIAARSDCNGHESQKDVSPLSYDTRAAVIKSEAFSPIMIVGALVLPDEILGIIEASATRKPRNP
jgi:hypothetical protein